MQRETWPDLETIRRQLEAISNAPEPLTAINDASITKISENLITEFPERETPRFAQGKVRDLLIGQKQILLLNTDRLSAFDCHVGSVPYRGVILAHVTEYWLNRAASLVPTMNFQRISERSFMAERCQPIPVEVVVRGYLAGAILRAYNQGERVFCGVNLPDGLLPYAKLPAPIITPTTKAEAFAHDEATTAAEVVAGGICQQSEWDAITSYALKLFADGQKHASEHGWILVDTKYEFGRAKCGAIKLIDELHTPDSSRFWQQSSYQECLANGLPPKMFDKQIVRQWLEDQGFTGSGPVPEVPAKVLLELATAYLTIASSLCS